MSSQQPTNSIVRSPNFNRTLLQNKRSSPTRRDNEGPVDRTPDGDGRSRLVIVQPKVEASTNPLLDDVLMSPKLLAAVSIKKPILSPRGRPQLHRDVSCAAPSSTCCMVENNQNEPSSKPMPMPTRPRNNCASKSQDPQICTPSLSKKDPRPKPYVPEVPSFAPRFPPLGSIDFFPWVGNHPEDQFSEHVIRQGYNDKSQMSQNEIGSARHFIFPAMKHKSGLQTLSSVFTNILAQRRAHGQITSSSTFKPPPRVTVTDTKREMWLKDLANSTMPLRRLSRSIPHGIRGKVLLEQSLGKNIPIERAVWLAKCVGANELRSFRRKGVYGSLSMGGEVKWIRDFTICVEQFLENIIGVCGDTEFKAKFSYAIRLATHFHAEYLLDREHYMDWVITSLENTSQVKLPIWLLVTQIYWKDILQSRKYGRRLSNSLLNQLAEVTGSPDCDLLGPLFERVTFLLKELMLHNYNNFVAPKTWAKYRDLIHSNIGSYNQNISEIIKSIDTRNSRLVSSEEPKLDHPKHRLIQILDDTLITPYKSKTAKEIWHLSDNKKLLIKTVLEWSTSSYRPGKIKIYVAARVLRAWEKAGVSITENVLSFLDSTSCESGLSKPDLYHIISELARSGHFSPSSYIQWLISRGGIENSQAIQVNGPCASRLLAELPTTSLSQTTTRTRLNLLSLSDFAVREEKELLKRCLSLLQKELTCKNEISDSNLEETSNLGTEFNTLISCGSRTIKAEVGLWLRENVRLQVIQSKTPLLDGWDKSIMKNEGPAITSSKFNTVREILEHIGDYSMLADVLKIFATSCGVKILASCADTLNLNLEIFAAIGALPELFEILLSRLRALPENTDACMRNFLTSLFDLSLRLEDQKIIAQELAQEVSRSYNKAGIDVCSPISDHMTFVENTEVNLTEEIEKILHTGSKIDLATLENLFQRIISVLELSERFPEQQRSCGALLSRLRSFNPTKFDSLMTKWVDWSLSSPNRPNIVKLYSPLISSGCLALHNVLENCEAKQVSSELSKLDTLPLEALALLFPSSEVSDLMTIEETYRFRIKQIDAQRNFSASAVSILRNAFELLPSTSTFDTQCNLSAENFLKSQDVLQLFQYVVLFHADLFTNRLLLPILKSSNLNAISAINDVIDLLLSTSSLSLITAEILFNIADDLSQPFCQIKLASMFIPGKESNGRTEAHIEQIEVLYLAVESAISAKKLNWENMIHFLDVEIAQQLRERAETQFLSLIPSSKSLLDDDPKTLQSQILHGKNLISIVKATSFSISATSSQKNNNNNLISEIAAALNGLWPLLASLQSQQVKNLIIESWIPLLFSFITVHASLFEATKLWAESRAKTVLALAATFIQLQALDFKSKAVEELIEQSYDLALYFVDSLPDDVRQQCIRSLRDAVSNTDISYLFSFVTNPSDHLVLSQKDRTGNPQLGNSCDEISSKLNEKIMPFPMRRWEMLGEPTPNVGENDTSLSLTLFAARKG